jgi:uncharacterized protein YkwD
LAIFAVPARADLLRTLNSARAEGCGGRPGIKQALQSNPKLNEAARRLQRGESLRDAMTAAGYYSIKSTSIRMSGRLSDSAVARNLSKQFCASLIDAELADVGFYRKGRELRMVLAQPFSTPSLRDAAAVSRRVLALTNEARSRGRRCGSEKFDAAGPLTLSPLLNRAALAHSRDMAAKNYFEHEARDGSQPADRVTRQGYKWRVVGENLAAGITTPEEAVSGWLGSPHHCANLMDPRFAEMGVAFAVNPASKLGIYWTQVFALPRK